MKKCSFLFLLAFYIFTIFNYNTVQAADMKYGDYIYTVLNKKVTITEYRGNEANVTIPEYIKGLKVISIGGASFANNESIKKVIIPDSVISIQYNAFAYCKNLMTVFLPEGLKSIETGAFYECRSLMAITLPESLSTIEDSVFAHCIKLEQVTFLSNITSIPSEIFYECNSLKEISLPAYIENIGRDAFHNCYSLQSINLSEGLSLIDEKAFYGCSSLAKIVLPKSLSTIGYSAFYGCKSIADIELPDGLVTLRDNSFYGCSLIKGITLPSTLKEYSNPFMECTSLETIIVDSNNETFMSEKGVLYSKDKTKLYCCPPKYQYDYTIPDTVTNIMDGAFASQNMLSEITVPDSVTEIQSSAFYKAVSVKKVNLPENTLKYLSGYTFKGSGIEELVIPEGVKYMDGSFTECNNLKSVSFPSSLIYIFPDESIGLFYKCLNLEKITVAKDNKFYYSVSGVLFQNPSEEGGARKIMLCYPAARKGKTYAVPKDIYLGTCAFDSCRYLRNVIIPEGIKSVFIVASNCRNITVTFPLSVIYFPPEGHNFPLFKNCTGYFAKVYKGSESYKYCKKEHIPYKLIK
jgi:archaellum component FlaF (FlaF/FlaG flagellin family)